MKRFALLLPLLFLILAVNGTAQTIREQYGGLGSFGSSASRNQVKLRALLVPWNKEQAEHEAVLVLEATIQPLWKLYGVSQPEDGALPARLELPPEQAEIIGAICPTAAPKVEHDPLFDAPVHEHRGSIAWVVPIRLQPDVTTVSGRFHGQICSEGVGGVCIPLHLSFDAELAIDEESLAEVTQKLDEAAQVPKEFRYSPLEKKEAPTDETGPATESVTASAAKEPPGNLDFLDGVRPSELETVSGIGMALVYALLGGLILNIMPCVLPVIGLKILSFFEQAGQSRSRAFLLNLVYVAGLLSVFLLLAAMSVGLSKLFTVGLFNMAMCVVVFAMALSLMGVWELSAPAFLGRGKSIALMGREGFAGAFFKGIITTLLAIPCGAPLLSPTIGWADQQIRAGQTPLVFLVYATIGLGMGLPYLLIGAFPELLRFLPKPGLWMETFKKIMGFALLIAVVWILYFIDLPKIVPMVALLFAVWFACWMIGRLDPSVRGTKRLAAWGWSAAVLILVLLFSFKLPYVTMPVTLENAMQRRLENWAGLRTEGHWAAYTHRRLEKELIDNRRMVLVDFTADWCFNCKVLEKTVLESQEVLDAIDRRQIVSLQADCTTSELEGAELLRLLGAESVPTMAIFRPDRPLEPIVIRGNYYASTLLDQLQ